jgi:uncharacterized membrane protein YhaH (DUF805 family)
VADERPLNGGPNATTVGNLFLSFQGRIGRLEFWIGTVVVTAIELALQWMLGIPITGDTPDLRLRAITFAIGLVSMYPTAAIAAKRLHDRGQPTTYVWLLVAALAVAMVGDLLGYFDDAAHVTLASGIAMGFVVVVCLAFLVELGFRRGLTGPNQYGPDPLDPGT